MTDLPAAHPGFLKGVPTPCLTCLPARVKLQGLGLILISVTAFAGVELWVGLISHSLSLRADSGHMLADGLALGIAIAATWMTQRSPATGKQSGQLENLAALINGLALLAMAAWIGREALVHWQGHPTEILSLPMLITALLGLLVNGVNLYWLHGGMQQDLNLRGVFLHILADLLGSVGAILAALAVTFLQWTWADTFVGTGVAVIIGISAVPLLRQSLSRLVSPSAAPPPTSETLQKLGWLEVGTTDLAGVIRK